MLLRFELCCKAGKLLIFKMFFDVLSPVLAMRMDHGNFPDCDTEEDAKDWVNGAPYISKRKKGRSYRLSGPKP